MNEVYRHRKTGNLYWKLTEVVDCTNSRDGTRAVVYCRALSGVAQFVRELAEFEEKFERVPQDPTSTEPKP